MTGLVDTEEADLRIRFDDAARDRLAGMLAQRPGGEAPGTGDAPGAGDEVAVGLYNRLQEPGLVDRTGERGEVAEIVERVQPMRISGRLRVPHFHSGNR